MENSKLPFVEEFSCKFFHEFKGNEFAKQFICQMIDKNKRKHFILNGPPGTGKKTLTHLYLQSLREQYDNRNDFILYFRCSSERCIQSIRKNIQSFEKSKISDFQDSQKLITKCIVFEDAETVSDGVQQLMRAIIDKTKVKDLVCIFLSHDNSKIIQPLQNKSYVINMRALTYDDLKDLLFRIVQKYPLILKESSLQNYETIFKTLIEVNKGNIRKILNSMEYLHAYTCSHHYQMPICDNTIKSITILPIYEQVSSLFHHIQSQQFKKVCAIYNDLRERGFRTIDLLYHLQQYLKSNDQLQNEHTIQFNECINLIALYLPRITQVSQPHIQMMSCLHEMTSVFK